MCETKSFNHFRSGGSCCCDEMMAPPYFRHNHSHFRPGFPTKKEQIEILKGYKQKLQEEIDEIEKRLKELD